MKKRIFNIITISILLITIIINVFAPNMVCRIIGMVDGVLIALNVIRKESNLYKVLGIVILLSVMFSYLVPGTQITYGTVNKGSITPIPFADLFSNGITAVSAFITTTIYVLFIGVFYALLKKTNKYEVLVNNTAASFNKNKGAFIVLTIFVLGLISLFTGEIYAMLVFVPFLISVIRKLGYDKPTSIVATIGAILIGNAGSLYTYYSNQMLNLTVKDNTLPKVIIGLVGLVSLVAFILFFNKKPESTKDLKKVKEKKMLPLTIIMILLLVFVILGFVNWSSLLGFNGFNDFLATLRKGKTPIFNDFVGQSVVAFGAFQTFNFAVLITFIGLIVALIYKIGVNETVDAFKEGLKKAFPYAVIVILANLVLVNTYTAGFFYTFAIALTKKITLLTGTVTSALAAIFYPDYGYGTQFTITAIMNTSSTDYQQFFAIVFQVVYSLFLLISPTSILVLFALRYNNIRYIDWVKYICKYFFVLFVALLLVASITMKGFGLLSIIALVLLVIAIILIFVLKNNKNTKNTKKRKK